MSHCSRTAVASATVVSATQRQGKSRYTSHAGAAHVVSTELFTEIWVGQGQARATYAVQAVVTYILRRAARRWAGRRSLARTFGRGYRRQALPGGCPSMRERCASARSLPERTTMPDTL